VDDDYVGETVAALLVRRAIEPRGVAVAIDGDVVPRSAWATTTVHDGALVEVLTAAAGG
jgi:sulfur carrier protein